MRSEIVPGAAGDETASPLENRARIDGSRSLGGVSHPDPEAATTAAFAYCSFLEHLEVQVVGSDCVFGDVHQAARALYLDNPEEAAALTASLIWREIQCGHAAAHDGHSAAREFWAN